METVKTPFLFVNPKSYLYGSQSLSLALAADQLAQETGVQIFFTCPYADLRLIAEHTQHIIVTAQNMDSLTPGRGMGAILPESLVEAGAKAVVLNHAENQKTVAELYACICRARELNLITIVCADSVTEAKAVAELGVDVILAEPTELIGTGTTADDAYTIQATRAIKAVDPDVKVMIASGITTAEDCYKVVYLGADGTGSTSGIVKAPDPALRVKEMVHAILQAMEDRNADQTCR
ncbi:MAG: triose-phosphate isomerase [Clostridiales bacterium]|nr:triose-phosphate isomerase [Clostridiales bacterium]